MDKKCVWSIAEPEWSTWNTCKGDNWQFNEPDDTPESHGMKFCPFCGKEIEIPTPAESGKEGE